MAQKWLFDEFAVEPLYQLQEFTRFFHHIESHNVR